MAVRTCIDRVLFAVDFPFEDQRTCVAAIENMPLRREDKHSLVEANARAVFRLTSQAVVE